MSTIETKPQQLSIRSTIEQKPFENRAAQVFFIMWCEINDSITPVFLEPEQWTRGKGGRHHLREDTADSDRRILYFFSARIPRRLRRG